MVKVLIVDDSKIMRSALVNYFNQFELNVITAKNGRQGIDMYIKQKPDVVLMDITMPGITGIEATKEILAQDSNAKVCMLTASSEKSVIKTAILAGASGYIAKPYNYERVMETIEYLSGVHIKAKTEDGNLFSSDYIKTTVRILVVEPNEFMAKSYIKSLKDYDCHVEILEDSHEALDVYKAFNPDILFMDINQSLDDGLRATKSIIDFDPYASVCIASSSGSPEKMYEAQIAGAIDYLIKPFDVSDLKRIIDELPNIELKKVNI